MSVIASALKHMLAAKMDHASIIAAVEDMEASLAPAKSARSERNARYYEANRDELKLKASERRLNATERLNASEPPPSPPSPDKENPHTPKENNPIPPLPPFNVGADDQKPKTKKPKEQESAPEYPPAFNLLVHEYDSKRTVKLLAFQSWSKLDEIEQDLCLDAVGPYNDFLEKERRRGFDQGKCGLQVFINQRRWEIHTRAAA